MTAFGCVNNTIRLRSGKYLDLANPKCDQFEFSDIAGGLSKICRFGGQIERWYSVAEHSYHCAMQAATDGLPVEVQRAVLLHDAAEAFVGDIVKPLKIMLPEYENIEDAIGSVIEDRFGVDFIAYQETVKEIDRAMLIAERRAMFSRDNVTWTGDDSVRKLSTQFQFWDWRVAEQMFVWRARQVGICIGEAAEVLLS